MLNPSLGQPLPSDASTNAGRRFFSRLSWPTIVLCLLVLAQGSLLGWALVAQHRAFNSNGWDLGWFDQIVWNTAHGHPFANSFAPWSFLGEHVEPILLAFALVYRIKADVEILLLTQVIVAVGAAIPLYIGARYVLKSAGAALLVTAAFLIAPQFNNAVLFDFHPEVMGVASIFAAFACLASRKPGWALVAMGSAFLLKEDAALVGIGMALLFWLYGYRRHGLALLGVSLVYFVLITSIVMPHARGGAGGPQARWSYLGETGPGIVLGAVRHPDRVVNHLVQSGPRDAVASLLAGQALMVLAGPAALIAVPVTAAHLLSSHDAEMRLQLHYGALPLGLAFVATTLGIARVAGAEQPWRFAKVSQRYRPVALASLLFGAQLVSAVVSGPFGLKFDPNHYSRPALHSAAVNQVLQMVPDNASVAAQSGLVPHLSQRRQIWEFPPAFGAQYVVVDPTSWRESHGPKSPELDYGLATAALPSNGYCLLFEKDGVQLWHLANCQPAPGLALGSPQVTSEDKTQ